MLQGSSYIQQIYFLNSLVPRPCFPHPVDVLHHPTCIASPAHAMEASGNSHSFRVLSRNLQSQWGASCHVTLQSGTNCTHCREGPELQWPTHGMALFRCSLYARILSCLRAVSIAVSDVLVLAMRARFCWAILKHGTERTALIRRTDRTVEGVVIGVVC